MNSYTLLLCFAVILAFPAFSAAQDDDAEPILVGDGEIEQLLADPYNQWWEPAYWDYELDKTTLKECRDKLFEAEFIVVMGTWCPDSKREVPIFYRILDEYGLTADHLIFLDKERKGGEEQEIDLGIEAVPTFIINHQGKELGRIKEMPRETMEKDLCRILNGEE